jgi:hypothetical protein
MRFSPRSRAVGLDFRIIVATNSASFDASDSSV